jgi:membrane-bound lytic murein transglycosylase MltF
MTTMTATIKAQAAEAQAQHVAGNTLETKAGLAALVLSLIVAPGLQAHAPERPSVATPNPASRQLDVATSQWTGDFDQMVERRLIRVLVPFSRSLYFNDRGTARGITADFVRDFERYINEKYAKQLGKRPLTVYVVPTTRDKLLTGVRDGLGDIAAGNITAATEERRKLVDFVAPADGKLVKELVVTGSRSPEIATVEDLSGRVVHVDPSSSYYESVMALNKRLATLGKAPVKIGALPSALEDEDKLEMLNAGMLQFIVVDDWMAQMWAQVYPKIKVREDLVLREEGRLGWAIRKQSPKLEAALLDFYVNFLKKQGVIAYTFMQYQKRAKQMSNNTGTAEWKRFEETLALFDKYGKQYRFDPLMLAAQGYQESQLNQDAKSRVGAIGIMQLMPATGQQLKVGDIHIAEANVHAGARYMDQLMTQYFSDAKFSDTDRALFAFASYNCGPGNVSKARKEAARRGLDPDRWFNNVEIVIAEQVGIETTTYVRNIYKYYAAYKFSLDAKSAQQAAREQVKPDSR